ncbi:MAG: CAP domain-containing protein, partial [Actinomycetota bacterium]|nr:CAP domain-containing protein [Actinomycetota bacterium]
HHTHLGRCAPVPSHRGRLRARAAASAQGLVWSWSAPHSSAASVPAASTSTGSGTPGSASPGSSTSAPCANADLIPTSDSIPLIATATLCLVNQQRALHGEHPLRDNAKLDSSATHHSQDMVAANYYDHTSPTGETLDNRVRASGYLPSTAAWELGENIDLGALTLATPAAMVAAWMASPGHRANILNPDFVDSGVGVIAQIPAQYASGEPSATYTQEFGVVQTANGVIS